ncbi:TIGR00730 family Rossman fold protein [candidate division KSB1 bacterium]|nr:TIGR00730 family Rossman fold protein [candidate division KSB1 bacterium]
MKIEKVCVYLASSNKSRPEYIEAARQLGTILAKNKIDIVYGGSSIGCMRHLADAALENGGRVIGVMPQFLCDLELDHQGLSEMIIVDDMHERKKKMVENVDAVISLPGGTGTLEELLEAITWKRLGILIQPIILINTNKFFNPLLLLFEQMIENNFLDPRHRSMWTVVESPDNVIGAIESAPVWSPRAKSFAAIR